MATRDLMPGGRGHSLSRMHDEDRHPLSLFQRDMNRLFDEFWRGFDLPMMGSGRSGSWPSMDLTESDQEYCLTAELPGLTENDVEVTINDDMLTIRGEKRMGDGSGGEQGQQEQQQGQQNQQSQQQNQHFSERYYGRFERSVSLGNDIDQDNVRAEFKNGVLTVHLPKSQNAQERSRRIPVNAGGGTAGQQTGKRSQQAQSAGQQKQS